MILNLGWGCPISFTTWQSRGVGSQDPGGPQGGVGVTSGVHPQFPPDADPCIYPFKEELQPEDLEVSS